MGIANIGIPGMILIIVVALIIFGPSKLPQFGKAAGQTIREFKTSIDNLVDEGETDDKEVEKEKLKKSIDE